MKKTETKAGVAVIIFSFIIFLTSSFYKSETGNKYLLVCVNSNLGSQISIVYEDGKTEQIDLESYSQKNALTNALKISQTINNIANKGYELAFTIGGDLNSTFVFQKK
jgi:hypothetical protein